MAIPNIAPSADPMGSAYARGGALDGMLWGPGNNSTELYKCAADKTWALTYDSGPTDVTPSLLNALSNTSIRATFFLSGSSLLSHPTPLLNATAHQLALTSWSPSVPLTTLTTDAVVSQIVWSALAVRMTLGVVPRYFRPPRGDVDDRVRAVVASFGLRPVRWNVDTADIELPATKDDAPGMIHVDGVVQRVKNAVSEGGMVGDAWMPGFPFKSFVSVERGDGSPVQVEAAKGVMGVLTNGGFKAVGVAECDGNIGGEYMGEGEAFVTFLDSIAAGLRATGTTGLVATTTTVAVPQIMTAGTGSFTPGKGIDGMQFAFGRMIVTVVLGMAAVGLLALMVLVVVRRRNAKRTWDEGEDGQLSNEELDKVSMEKMKGGKDVEAPAGFITSH
ncbi:chitin deacetylase [Irineochytrium annulatum]|nr:chitin deacetylase [Irineochytrium annulatum]